MGTYTPPGHWNQIAAQVAQDEGNSLTANARLFAALNLAMADAAIACWDAKYAYRFWRPVTAIRAADTDGNPDTGADPSWTPLLTTPNFPEYVSGHSTFSGAAEVVLSSFFGPDVAFSTSSAGLPGVTRSYTSFRAAAEEAALSRLYAGIHFRFSNQDGLTTGRAVARYVGSLTRNGKNCTLRAVGGGWRKTSPRQPFKTPAFFSGFRPARGVGENFSPLSRALQQFQAIRRSQNVASRPNHGLACNFSRSEE